MNKNANAYSSLYNTLDPSLVRNNQSHCTVTAAAKNLNAPK